MKKLLVPLIAVCFVCSLFAAQRSFSEELNVAKSDVQVAQADAKETKPAAAKTKAKPPAGRLPNNYGQIGLSEEQRTKIYGIQARFKMQVDALEKQIAALKAQESDEINAVLTDSQKETLASVVAEAKKAADERKAAAAKKKTDEKKPE